MSTGSKTEFEKINLIIVEKLKINQISFVGHSQGCLVGLEFASRFPKLIKSLVLVAKVQKILFKHEDLPYLLVKI